MACGWGTRSTPRRRWGQWCPRRSCRTCGRRWSLVRRRRRRLSSASALLRVARPFRLGSIDAIRRPLVAKRSVNNEWGHTAGVAAAEGACVRESEMPLPAELRDGYYCPPTLITDLSPTSAAWKQVSQNGQLLSRRGRSSPANASGCDTHRDSISSRSDCRRSSGRCSASCPSRTGTRPRPSRSPTARCVLCTHNIGRGNRPCVGVSRAWCG
jgi:hypothetical protein